MINLVLLFQRLVSTSHDHYNDTEGFRPYSTITPDVKMEVTRPAPVHSPPTMRSSKRQNVISARTPRDPPCKASLLFYSTERLES